MEGSPPVVSGSHYNTMCCTMCSMARRFNEPVNRRTPLPLTEHDEADLAKLRDPGPARTALANLAPGSLPDGDISEALLLHAVFVVGLRAVREAAEAAAYDQVAADYAAEDAERRRIARRRRPEWAAED
jgi:hypothetical protein